MAGPSDITAAMTRMLGASPHVPLALAAGAAASLLVLAQRRRREPELMCQPCDNRSPPPKSAQPKRQAQTPRRALLGVDELPTVGLSRDPDATTKRDCYIGWDDVRSSRPRLPPAPSAPALPPALRPAGW